MIRLIVDLTYLALDLTNTLANLMMYIERMSFIVEPLSRFTDWAMHGAKKRVYYFSEGSLDDKDLLGLKGANLCEMARLGLPVPPGIIISSEACVEHFKERKVESTVSVSISEPLSSS